MNMDTNAFPSVKPEHGYVEYYGLTVKGYAMIQFIPVLISKFPDKTPDEIVAKAKEYVDALGRLPI